MVLLRRKRKAVRIQRLRQNAVLHIYNAMGDVIGLYDQYGDVIYYHYDSWRKLFSITNVLGEEFTYGSTKWTIAQDNPFRYRGYMYDEESGFYYLNSRYYDPETGRFINADNFLVGDSVLGMNLYAYCVNNPVNLADPSGQFVLTFTAICTIAAKAVATVVMLAVAVPLTMELGETMADGLSGITAQPIPAETPTIDISPSIEKEEVTTVPVPDEATQEATRTQQRSDGGIYYIAHLCGNGAIVELSNPLSYDEAFLFVTQGQDIWVRDQDLAYNIAFYAAGGHAHIKPRKPQQCTPIPGYKEKRCVEGTAAFHFHVSGKRYDDVHIFYGDQAIFFY